jgi:hypothetical protein
MQKDLTRAVEKADVFASWSDSLRSLRAGVAPHLSETSKSAKSKVHLAALLAQLEADNAALRHRAAELALDIHKLAERSE